MIIIFFKFKGNNFMTLKSQKTGENLFPQTWRPHRRWSPLPSKWIPIRYNTYNNIDCVLDRPFYSDTNLNAEPLYFKRRVQMPLFLVPSSRFQFLFYLIIKIVKSICKDQIKLLNVIYIIFFTCIYKIITLILILYELMTWKINI